MYKELRLYYFNGIYFHAKNLDEAKVFACRLLERNIRIRNTEQGTLENVLYIVRKDNTLMPSYDYIQSTKRWWSRLRGYL